MINSTFQTLIDLVQSSGLPVALVIFATIKLDKFLTALSANLTNYNEQLSSLEITIVKLTGAIDNLKEYIK